jgi:hypothetical protein
MTIAMLNRQADRALRCSLPQTGFATAVAPVPAILAWPASTSPDALARFARAWALAEPAFVAQQHREWSL